MKNIFAEKIKKKVFSILKNIFFIIQNISLIKVFLSGYFLFKFNTSKWINLKLFEYLSGNFGDKRNPEDHINAHEQDHEADENGYSSSLIRRDLAANIL